MTFTGLICSKCGRTEEYDKALKVGWLCHQIKGAPEGHLIIRCPEHVTGHALRLAGLPQQKVSKRISDNLDRGLWCEYGDGYIASVWYDLGGAAQSIDEIDDPEWGAYILQCHKGENPPFRAVRFHNLEGLIGAMRNAEPDLRKWKLRQS